MSIIANPLLLQQWHLGQSAEQTSAGLLDLNVVNVWHPLEGLAHTGMDVRVVVIDTGFDLNHEDLASNFQTEADWDFLDNDADPLPVGTDYSQHHGTAVAGIIAAANNQVGGLGVAFDASLIGYRVGGTLGVVADAIYEAAISDLNDVTNLSLGTTGGKYIWSRNIRAADLSALSGALGHAVEEGRDGYGMSLVKAAGNFRYLSNDIGGFDFDSDTRQIIVGAVDQDGFVSQYSSYGAAILVSAFGTPGEVVSTDRTRADGYSSGNYTTTFNGTSAAAPMVSGVVALMYSANEHLGWRDVQSILAASARQVGSEVGSALTGAERFGYQWNKGTTWNGGGMHHSQDYGYGLVDALAAVRLAETWHYGTGSPEVSHVSATSRNEITLTADVLDTLTDIGAGVGSKTFSGAVSRDVCVERVTLQMTFSAANIGDLDLYLISPSGTRTRLITDNGTGAFSGTWTFETQALRGERTSGTWMVEVSDDTAGDLISVSDIRINVFGSDTLGDRYIFTNEYSDYAGLAWHTTNISDGNGGVDVANTAAVSSASVIRLDGGTSVIDGVSISLNYIENAIGGDFGDRIYGSDGVNSLWGMRGNDQFWAAYGNDEVYGGSGSDLLMGQSGADDLVGDLGHDWLDGGAGDDTLLGGAGSDTLEGGAGADRLEGGDGRDLLSYAGSATDVIVNLAAGSAAGGDAEGDTHTGFEDLVGGDGSDSLIGSAGVNRIDGGRGADTLNGGGGADQLYGGAGSDRFIVAWHSGPSGDASSASARIGDFTAGSEGDRIDLSLLIAELQGYSAGQDAFAAGFLRLWSNGTDAELQVDIDQDGTGWQTVLVLDDVLATALTSANIVQGWTPNPNRPPILAPIADQVRLEDAGTWSFLVPAATDVDSAGLTYAATLADGSQLPSWLTFNASTRTFSGTPPQNFNGAVGIKVTASDGLLAAARTFDFIVTAVNDAPILLPIADQVRSEDAGTWFFQIPAATDVDSAGLTYAATLADGSPLPSWLTFNASTRTFSGMPPQDFNGAVGLRVSASDGAHSAWQEFALVINRVNDAPTELSLGTSSVPETARDGTVVGTLSAVDVDSTSFTYSLLDDAGGRFALSGNRVVVADGLLLDFEQTTSHVLQVRVSDGTGGTWTENVTVELTNVSPEIITGDARANTFVGGEGADVLDGGPGSDRLSGGAGNDTYVVQSGDVVTELVKGGTVDLVRSASSWTLGEELEWLELTGTANLSGTGNQLANRLAGNGAANVLTGLGGNDVILGLHGRDRLQGGTGSDRLYAGSGSDKLDGGSGQDRLYGGKDSAGDVFIFSARSHSAVGSAHDIVHNFTRGSDDISLRAIDARPASDENDAFTWGGQTAGAYRVWWKATGDGVLLRADTTGNTTADFEVLLSGLTSLRTEDVLL